MTAKVIKVFALEKFIHPSIYFEVELDYQKFHQAVFGVEGNLMTEDDVILGHMHEVYLEKSSKEPQGLSARGTMMDNQLFRQEKYGVSLVVELDEKSINEIDRTRIKNRKQDVELKLELFWKVIECNAEVAHYFHFKPPQAQKIPIRTSSGTDKEGELIVWAYDHEFRSEYSNGWIISGSNGPTFLNIRTYREECQYCIPSSDWIHDFAPRLGLGRFLILEIPSEGETIKETTSYLTKAEEAFMRWDTKGVFSHCREIGVLLDSHIKKIYGEDSFTYKERWGRAYERFNHWASLDLHQEDFKKKYPPSDVVTRRADAENLLMSTKVLIKYAQELMKETKSS